ncbi:FecR family protein [Radicibacter daui]|uniref:FecR family protein n=1 Tax=Radicibacter daui TaxID=3064829 RepID=UPI004046EEDB
MTAATLKPDMPRKLAEEAALWAARLQSGDASEEDIAAFEDWLAQDPRHTAAYAEFQDLWADLEQLPLQPGRLQKIRRARTVRRAGFVTSLAVLLLFAGLYRAGLYDRYRADYYTGVGVVDHVTLEDGTIVSLNSDTAIRVHYTPERREIELLRGEAFFEVSHNAARPFIVEDNDLRARAVGTRYSVRAGSGNTTANVRVEEGLVEVQHGDDHALLHAGQSASLEGNGTLAVETTDVVNQTAWRTGKLVFSRRPLRSVLASLEKYRLGRIVLTDDQTGDQLVSGIFDLADTDQALRALAARLPIRVTYATDLLVIIQKR